MLGPRRGAASVSTPGLPCCPAPESGGVCARDAQSKARSRQRTKRDLLTGRPRGGVSSYTDSGRRLRDNIFAAANRVRHEKRVPLRRGAVAGFQFGGTVASVVFWANRARSPASARWSSRAIGSLTVASGRTWWFSVRRIGSRSRTSPVVTASTKASRTQVVHAAPGVGGTASGRHIPAGRG